MSIKHFWLFTTGNTSGGAFTSHGHFTMNTQTNTSEGVITLTADDNSFIAQGTLEEFEFIDGQFTAKIGFTAIQGTPPFPVLPATVTFPLAPVGIATPSAFTPNLFAFIGDPAPVPPQV